MTRTVFQLRTSEAELERWKSAANGPLSPWLRRLANEEADAVLAKQHDLLHQQARRDRLMQVTYPGKRNYEPDPK